MFARVSLLVVVLCCLTACAGGPPSVAGSASTSQPSLQTITPDQVTSAMPQPTPGAAAPTAALAAAATAEVTPAPTVAATSTPATTAGATSTPATTAGATSTPATAVAATSATAVAANGSEILFLRHATLLAFDVQSKTERTIASDVHDFTAAPDGQQLALIRGSAQQTDLWVVARDGSQLTRLTTDARIEAMPSWGADNQTIVFASAATSQPYTRAWPEWAAWCRVSEVHLLTLSDRSEQSLGPGCDPAFSPDGRRIAYATPPTVTEDGIQDPGAVIQNSIRVINRQGQNGWNMAQAHGPTAAAPYTGRLVYAPAWSPDGSQVVYQRFLGYQALVDLDLSEMAGSLTGRAQPIGTGAGWMLPARFASDGQSVVLTENDYSDARGFSGYDTWTTTVVRLSGQRDVALPEGQVRMLGQEVERLPRGQIAAWAPDGNTLAVELPPGWHSGMSPAQPVGNATLPGEIWQWQPGQGPQVRLIREVDPASPVAWLAPTSA